MFFNVKKNCKKEVEKILNNIVKVRCILHLEREGLGLNSLIGFSDEETLKGREIVSKYFTEKNEVNPIFILDNMDELSELLSQFKKTKKLSIEEAFNTLNLLTIFLGNKKCISYAIPHKNILIEWVGMTSYASKEFSFFFTTYSIYPTSKGIKLLENFDEVRKMISKNQFDEYIKNKNQRVTETFLPEIEKIKTYLRGEDE